MRGRTRVEIDYSKCGDGKGVDPRECAKCLRACDPAIFILHQTPGVKLDPWDPQLWRVTPIWLSLCTRCMKCVGVCPVGAVSVRW